MGLLDDYSGIGMSPRPQWKHQIAMSNFHTNACTELYQQGLQLLTEATVTNDWNDLAPDLVVFDAHFVPQTVIEITRTYQARAIINKCAELIERFPDAEYFVYDYEQRLLYGFDAERQKWITSDEYELFSQYLAHPVLAYFG
ncbi:MAG: hypothetical protein II644_08380 [Paludibacteraceae bacterium]|nr:hypothetical protein [Paludibacteraceae bacterium]